MNGWRVDGASGLDLERIERELVAGRKTVAQWTRPPEDMGVLRAIDALCERHGALLEVRFYGWYGLGGHFDAAILEHVPNVRYLSVDCLGAIANEDAIARLAHLEDLRFGVSGIADGALLARLPLAQMRRISLIANRRRNFDLAPLAAGTNLEHVFIEGHTRNIAALSGLPHLRKLDLSGMPKTQPLDFINPMPALRELYLILGSRESIAELAHPRLDKLSVVWLRGLETLGDLSRFPALTTLVVEDQLRVDAIDLAGALIERLRIDNCKTLTRLDGLDALDRLEWLHVSRTKLDLDALRDRAYPQTTRSIGLFSGSRKWNDATATAFAARGITQFPEPATPALQAQESDNA